MQGTGMSVLSSPCNKESEHGILAALEVQTMNATSSSVRVMAKRMACSSGGGIHLFYGCVAHNNTSQ